METYGIYLRPKGSLAGTISSDTLFGALCWSIKELYGTAELEGILSKFRENPKFIISSAFPYLYRDSEKVRFFPKPLLPSLSSLQVDGLASESKGVRRGPQNVFVKRRAIVEVVEKEKPIRSVDYFSQRLFEEIVKGEIETESLFRRFVDRGVRDEDIEKIGNALITKGERVLINPDGEQRLFWGEVDVQRNEIDRLTGSTVEGRLFFTKETFFTRSFGGLWFILRTDDLEYIKPLLRYLEDTGIGGERTVGKGHFAIPLDEICKVEIPDSGKDANCFITLSRYIPLNDECAFEQRPLSYSLSSIRPKHESRLPGINHRIYKKMLRVFEIGSILPIQSRKEPGYYGQIVPVGINAEKAGWHVWHNGMTIPVFAKIRGDE
ncbi:MAG: RAMP superfamily CRISPR-associated protein [Nitrospirota bacterium]